MLRFTICLILMFSFQHLLADDKKYTIDDSHFSLGFLVEHAGYSKTLGLFKHIEGDFIYDESSNSVKNLSIIVNTDSVFTNHEKRDSHLRSPDFLNTAQYPTMTFEVKEYALNDTPGQIKGNLTLLGITKPINLDFKINKIAQYPFRVGLSKPMVMGVSASTSFKRSDYGMSYALEKELVGDEIELIIEFEARQK